MPNVRMKTGTREEGSVRLHVAICSVLPKPLRRDLWVPEDQDWPASRLYGGGLLAANLVKEAFLLEKAPTITHLASAETNTKAATLAAPFTPGVASAERGIKPSAKQLREGRFR